MLEKHWAQAPASRNQIVLFSPSLDEAVSTDAAVRVLDHLLNLVDWVPWERRYDGHRGQPPIHPRLMAGCILYGLMLGIRSSRELEDSTRMRLDFIWFLEGRTIDHSTFAGFRVRFGAELKTLNREIGKLICARHEDVLLGLVIDGTRIRANSGRHGARTAQCLERLVNACVQELDKRLERLQELDEQDQSMDTEKEALRLEVKHLQEEVEKYKRALEVAGERDVKKQQVQGKNTHPVRVPVTDPDAQITPNKEGGFAPNYTPVIAVSAEHGHIVFEDVLPDSDEGSAVPAAVKEAQSVPDMKVSWIAADSSFAGGEHLQWLEEQDVQAYMPTNTDFRETNPANRPDPTQPVPEEQLKHLPRKDKKFSGAAFFYDAEQDTYYCPAGKPLHPARKSKYHRTGIEYTKYQCPGSAGCPMAEQCVKENATLRTIQRDIYQPTRDKTGRRMATQEGKDKYKKRAPVVEGTFGVIKNVLGVRQFLVRGLDKVRIEWSWICGAFNLKRLIRLMMAADSRPDKGGPRPTSNQNGSDTRHTPMNTACVLILARIGPRAYDRWCTGRNRDIIPAEWPILKVA